MSSGVRWCHPHSPMIAQALKYICQEVNFINDNPATPSLEEFVVLGNISRLDSTSGANNADLQSKVILTLVNLEEEKTLKNGPYYVQEGETLVKKNPTIYLNLYLLFSCATDDYETALTKISRIIGTFQAKHVFTPDTAEMPFPGEIEKIILDLFSINFEQSNHMWGILGGKYIPSVLYKARLIAIQASKPEGAAVVREIKATENAR